MIQNKLIATYARVSTARQEEEQTIQTQILTLKDVAEKNGYTIVREYNDEGWSGDMLARPALDKLRQDAKLKHWEAVLIYDPDRLARRYSFQELVMDELREAGIEVIFVTIAAPKNSEDKILHGVRGLFAEYERTKITERFRLGKVRKLKEGHILVARPLYGYVYIPKKEKEHGFYQINESEARVVRMIFDWVANEHLTTRNVAKRLYELGIKPQRCKREVWCPGTIRSLLRNTAYYGQWNYGKRKSVTPIRPHKNDAYRKQKKSSAQMRPENEWMSLSIPPIVTKELFEKAGNQLSANYAFASRNKRFPYLLSGKIWCVCGTRRCGESSAYLKYGYYRCLNKKYSYPLPANCDEKPLNVLLIDGLIWQRIVSLMCSPELIQEQIEKYLKSRENNLVQSEASIISIHKEITKLKKHEERYTKAYGSGAFSIEKLKSYIEPIQEKITSLSSQLALNRSEKVDFRVPNEQIIRLFALEAQKVLLNADFNLRRGIVLTVIEKVVGTREHLEIFGYLPEIKEYGLQHDHKHDVSTINELSKVEENGLRHNHKDDESTSNKNNSVIMKRTIPFTFKIKLEKK